MRATISPVSTLRSTGLTAARPPNARETFLSSRSTRFFPGGDPHWDDIARVRFPEGSLWGRHDRCQRRPLRGGPLRGVPRLAVAEGLRWVLDLTAHLVDRPHRSRLAAVP